MHFCEEKRTSGSEKARLGDDLRNGQVPFKKPSQHSSQHNTSDKTNVINYTHKQWEKITFELYQTSCGVWSVAEGGRPFVPSY